MSVTMLLSIMYFSIWGLFICAILWMLLLVLFAMV